MRNLYNKLSKGLLVFFCLSLLFISTTMYAIFNIQGFAVFFVHWVLLPMFIICMAGVFTFLFYPSIIKWLAMKGIDDDE